MPKKPAIKYPKGVAVEAKLRRMRPDDYIYQMKECIAADQRMVEIDRKKLEEMQPDLEPDFLN
jgi:hypothetical protein